MKIGMQTWGSHGDIRPFLALAEGLQAAGHEVTLLITCFDSAIYSDITSTNGVNIRLIASPVISIEEAEKIATMAYNIRDPMKQIATILERGFEPVEDQMFAAAQQLSKDNDLLIGHYFIYPLQVAAEKTQKPYISVVLANIVVPSDYANPLGFNRLGLWGHRIIWWVTKFSINRVLLHYPNRLRQQLGMKPTRDILTQVWMSPYLTLLAVSPQFCQRQPDWPSSVQVCGFLDTPNMTMEGVIPASLKSFLDAGEPPVYMTFGSWMPHEIANQTATLRLLTDAANLAGCRAIIQSPSSPDCGFTSNDQIFYISAAPHYAIFPHCQAVVHHGGAGTTQSTTISGKPSIVVTHLSEQEHWGRELHRVGIAGDFLHRRNLTSKQLARKIQFVLNSPELSLKAKSIAEAMKKENGVDAAVNLIQQRFAV